jgi:hypothetical protein
LLRDFGTDTYLSHFTRLSSLGAAVLIFIMVVMLYPVLPPEPKEAHAATRLGLHVTQEELIPFPVDGDA